MGRRKAFLNNRFRFLLHVVGACLLVAGGMFPLHGQTFRTFLGGSPIDPNGWTVAANWTNLVVPSLNENVLISSGAFARFDIGTRTFGQVSLGAYSSGSRTALEITRGSILGATGLNTENGRVSVFGSLQMVGTVRDVVIPEGGSLWVGEGTSNLAATFLSGSGTTMLVNGSLEIAQRGRMVIGGTLGESVITVGSAGRVTISQGSTLATNVRVEVANGGRLDVSGGISSDFRVNLNGADSTVAFENSQQFSTGNFGARVRLHSDAGARVTYEGKGSMLSANMSGTNIRAKIGLETNLQQLDSTAGVSLTMENLSSLTYYSRSATFSNSLGGPLSVQGDSTIAFSSSGFERDFYMLSVQLAVNDAVNLQSGSILRWVREGIDVPVTQERLVVSFNSLNPWTVASNSTIEARPWTQLQGVGLTYLSNPNLTTRLVGNAVVDLTDSFGNRTINNLDSTSTSSLVRAGTHELRLNRGDFAGQIQTTGGLRVGGEVTVRSGQSYGGGTVVDPGGRLTLVESGALGSGNVVVNGELALPGITESEVTLSELSGNGQVTFGPKSLTFTSSLARMLGVTFNGTGTLIKEGSGTTRFSGAMTGGTLLRVNAGTFFIESTIHRRVEVASGATIAGTGRIGELVLAAGATLSPGNSPGSLQAGATTWTGGATYLWEINNANGMAGAPDGWDLIDLTGSLMIDASSATPFVLNVVSLNATNAPGSAAGFLEDRAYSFTIATASGGIFGFDPTHFQIQTSGFSDGLASTGTFWLTQSGNNLVLNYQTIPEPSTFLLLGLAMALGMLRRPRRI